MQADDVQKVAILGGQALTSGLVAYRSQAGRLPRGCSQEALVDTGGAGLFYCFATD